MSTKKIPARETEVCDFCGREGYLQKCWACGRDFCLTHEGIVGQCWGFTQVCHECAGRDDVRKICDKYAGELTAIFHRRNEALKRLSAKVNKVRTSADT